MFEFEKGDEWNLEGRVLVYTPVTQKKFKKPVSVGVYSTLFRQDFSELFGFSKEGIRKFCDYHQKGILSLIIMAEPLKFVKESNLKIDIIKVTEAYSMMNAKQYIDAGCELYWTKYFELKECEQARIKRVEKMLQDSTKGIKYNPNSDDSVEYMFRGFIDGIYQGKLDEDEVIARVSQFREFFRDAPFIREVESLGSLLSLRKEKRLKFVETQVQIIDALSRGDYELASELKSEMENH